MRGGHQLEGEVPVQLGDYAGELGAKIEPVEPGDVLLGVIDIGEVLEQELEQWPGAGVVRRGEDELAAARLEQLGRAEEQVADLFGPEVLDHLNAGGAVKDIGQIAQLLQRRDVLEAAMRSAEARVRELDLIGQDVNPELARELHLGREREQAARKAADVDQRQS